MTEAIRMVLATTLDVARAAKRQRILVPEPILRLEQVTMRLGDHVAVDRLDLKITGSASRAAPIEPPRSRPSDSHRHCNPGGGTPPLQSSLARKQCIGDVTCKRLELPAMTDALRDRGCDRRAPWRVGAPGAMLLRTGPPSPPHQQHGDEPATARYSRSSFLVNPASWEVFLSRMSMSCFTPAR